MLFNPDPTKPAQVIFSKKKKKKKNSNSSNQQSNSKSALPKTPRYFARWKSKL